MPLSKTIVPRKRAESSVLDFVPPQLTNGVPEAVVETYLKSKETSHFRLNEAIAQKTGVAGIETAEFQETVERKTLEKLKDIQEAAYKEAFQLGLIEGRKNAFESQTLAIEDRLKKFDGLINSIFNLKKELFLHNESHLVQLMFHMATRLAHREMTTDKASVVEVIKQAVEKAQSEEIVTVQVSTDQFEFLETLKTETSRELEFLKKVRFVGVEGISAGGCIIETNYGEVDSRFEERVGKLWDALVETLPKTKEKITAA